MNACGTIAKLVCCACFCVAMLLSSPVPASGSGEGFRERVSGRRVEMSVSWLARMGGKTYSGDGVLVWKDGLFLFRNDEVRVYNDGRTLVSVTEAGKEVVVQPSFNADFLENPSSLASLLGLNASKAGVSIRYARNGDPAGADIVLKDGTAVTATVDSMKVTDSSGDGEFSFDFEALDSSWVITDLR